MRLQPALEAASRPASFSRSLPAEESLGSLDGVRESRSVWSASERACTWQYTNLLTGPAVMWRGQVSMALGSVAEEATMYADDLESDFKRALLASLKASLPAVLPMLTSALEQHFGQALAAAQGGGKEAATAHAAVVTAALGEAGWWTLVPSKAILQ